MINTALSAQNDALERSLLEQPVVPERALRALLKFRELEMDVMELRSTLVDLPMSKELEADVHHQIGMLLSRVLLFRLALAEPTHLAKPTHDHPREASQELPDRVTRA